MGDFNHGHIQWKYLESTGGEGDATHDYVLTASKM